MFNKETDDNFNRSKYRNSTFSSHGLHDGNSVFFVAFWSSSPRVLCRRGVSGELRDPVPQVFSQQKQGPQIDF